MKQLFAAAVLFLASGAIYAAEQSGVDNGADSTPQVPSLDQARRGVNAQGQPMEGAKRLPAVTATSEENFEAAKSTVYPMTPAQVKQFQDYVDEQRRAARAKIKTVPVITGETIDLKPGAAPQYIRAAPYNGATVAFIDAMGNPWPIKHITNFSPEDFKVESPFAGSNSMTVSNLGSFGQGSMAVWLVGLESTPIPLTAFGGQKETDSLRSLRVPRMKPGSQDAAPPSLSTPAANVDRRLNDILEGVTPDGVVSLKTNDVEVRAWQLDDLLVVRTNGTLMSQFNDRVPSTDGTAVYSMPMTPQITVSRNGVPKQIEIEF